MPPPVPNVPHQLSSNQQPLSDNSAAPRRARDLYSRANSKANATATKQRRTGTRVDAEIEVQVGAVLVRAGQAILSTERVSGRRAQVGDLNHDAVASVGQAVAAAISLSSQLPACAAGGTGAGAWAYAKFVLGDGSGVTGLR